MYRLLSILLFLVTTVHTFRIGSFNIKQFGKDKAKNERVKNITAEILSGFDLVAIQEFSGDMIGLSALVGELASISNNGYVWWFSKPQGRSNTKERYAFAYRHSIPGVKILHVSNYRDAYDLFERPP